MNLPFVSKKAFKLRAGKCHICDVPTYDLLDVHRIIWGGKYSTDNCVCLCVSCHRKVHNEIIIVHGWVHSTKGRLLHYVDEEGNEQFKP